jgi:hypothetical protein
MKISHILLAAGFFATSWVVAAEEKGTNGIVFSTKGDARWSDMQQRLANPEERRKMRAEIREHMPAQYPDLAEALRIDAETEGKLFDLLADAQVARQEQMFASRTADAQPHAEVSRGFAMLDDIARQETASKQAIRKLIGDEAFERYLQYDTTRMERMEVARFDERLDAADKLTVDQKYKMMALVRERNQQMYARPLWSVRARESLSDMNTYLRMSEQERQAVMLKRNIELNEDAVRRLHEEKAVLMEHVRPILNAKQIDAFSEWQDDRIATARNHVQKMRASAGMNPEFDENLPSSRPEEPARFEGKVRLQMAFTLDGKAPVLLDLTTDNGKTQPAVEIAPKLWAEATPVLYASGDGNVMIQYYEERGGVRQRLPGPQGIGTSSEQSSRPIGRGGGGGGLVSGSRAYNVMTEARLSPAP